MRYEQQSLIKLSFIFVLIAITFSGCSDEDSLYNQSDNYNPIKGEWNAYGKEGELLHSRTYTENFEAYFSIIDGIFQEFPQIEHYSIAGNNIYFNDYSQTFEMLEDTLWITNSKKDQVTKYIRKKTTPIE